MEGTPGPEPARAAVRLVALLLLLAYLFGTTGAPSSTALAAVCAGDEQILFFAPAPRVGDLVIVAVFSQAAHDQAFLLGPTGPIPVQREPIGNSFLWQESVALEQAGENQFVFGVTDGTEPLTACAGATLFVTEGDPSALVASLNPYGQYAAPATNADVAPETSGAPEDVAGDDATTIEDQEIGGEPHPTRTPRPTRTPTPRPDNENGNGNENGNDNAPTKTPTRAPASAREPTPTREPTSTRVPTATRTPRPDPTDTPAPTPTLGPASIASLSPARPICGQPLKIRGERFGSSQNAVDGGVRIDGRETAIDSWSMTEIGVSVPNSVRGGNSRLLEVIVSGRTVTTEIAITC